jgi:hypothetical protein
MITIEDTKLQIEKDEKHWLIPFMDFVDEFRRRKDISLVQKPFKLSNERIDALLASTVEFLCDELNLKTPEWVWNVPVCNRP